MFDTLQSMTVGEVVSHIPKSTLAFRKRKIDFCCGGRQALKPYLDQDPSLLPELKELQEAPEASELWLNKSTEQIVHDLVKEFHEKHRRELPELIFLAKKVELRHKEHPQVPQGLGRFLETVKDDLEQHMQKEEHVLFPWLIHEPESRPLLPIQVLTEEHLEHKQTLIKLDQMTQSYTPPEGACMSWRALYHSLSLLAEDLQQHIHIENNILFKRVLER